MKLVKVVALRLQVMMQVRRVEKLEGSPS